MRVITWANAAGFACLVNGLFNLLSAITKTGPAWGSTVAIGTAFLCVALLHFRYSGAINNFYATLVVFLATFLATFSSLPTPAAQWVNYGALLGVVLLTLVSLGREVLAKK